MTATAATPRATPEPPDDRSAGNRPLGSLALVRLVAGREVSTRLRDRTFLISSAVILLLVIGAMAFQAVMASRGSSVTVGVVGDPSAVAPALVEQGRAAQVEVTVPALADEQAARRAVADGDVDGALVDAGSAAPRLLVQRTASGPLQAVVGGAVAQLALSRQLAQAGVQVRLPQLAVAALQPDADRTTQRVVAAIIGSALLYTLLALFGQFVAQGVVEEKASRVVELLLAAMRPWHLLAGKILGLGVLGLGQILVLAAVGLAGATAFDVVTVPGDLVGTVLGVVAWFVLGYALYAALYAAAGALVSRQEDLATVSVPITFLLLAGLLVAVQAANEPEGPLARVTSFVPGLSPLVMPVREAAGGVAAWQVAVSAALMLLAIALVVRLGGRVYAGALLRTGGRTKLREALAAERL